MTILTDKVNVENGADYTFVCGKIPFAITCSSSLQHGAYNLIDLDVVNKMKIPLQRIKVCRMTYLGENLRSAGFIDQTIQCVKNGVVKGTIHLSAKVVRNLFDNFNVDCIASNKTFEKLTGNKPPDPPDTQDVMDDQTEDIKEKFLVGDNEDEEEYSSVSSSACSDGRHEPVSKEWLFGATLIAQTAQKDGEDTLLEIENGLANVKDDSKNNDDEDNDNTSTSDACTNTKDENENEENNSDEDMHCELCFRFGKPINIVTNHDTFCPTCPTMTPRQKEVEIGTDWKARAEVIIRERFEREKRRRKDSADQ